MLFAEGRVSLNGKRWRPDWRRASAFAVRFLVFLAIAVSLQWYSGAYRAESSGESDEASHIVTGLMVRDYLLHGPWAQPMAFARPCTAPGKSSPTCLLTK